MSLPAPALNTSLLKFPTDQLTLAQIRAHDQHNLSWPRIEQIDATDVEAIATHAFELEFAHKVFAERRGLKDPSPDLSRRELLQTLDRAYQRFGISSGPQQSALLVASIEKGVQSQAEGPTEPTHGR